MALNWRNVPNYASRLYDFIQMLEAPTWNERREIQYAPKPTIGVGFDLVAGGRAVQDQVLIGMGLSEAVVRISAPPAANTVEGIEYGYIAQLRSAMTGGGDVQALLDQVMAARASDSRLSAIPDRRADFRFASDDEIRSVFTALAPSYLRRATASAPFLRSDPQFPASAESMVLISLTWNGVAIPKLAEALRVGDRAEAWFQIRYNSNGGNSRVQDTGVGLQKRRFLESEVFSLYADPGAPTLTEARDAVAMYQRHQVEITREETYWTNRTTKQGVTAFQAARTDYQNLLSFVPDGTIDSLVDNFEPAKKKLVEEIGTTYTLAIPAGDFSALAIFATSSSDSKAPVRLDARIYDSSTDRRDNVMLGDERANQITAGAGDDVIVGGRGDDHLDGGVGNDRYVFRNGEGKDTITDSDGSGSLILSGEQLRGAGAGDFHIDGTLAVWNVDNGRLVYRLDENHKRLEISGAALGAGAVIAVENFDIGRENGAFLGINLERPVKGALTGAAEGNPFEVAGAVIGDVSQTVAEFGGLGIKWFANVAVEAGDTITISSVGANGSKASVITGAETISLASAVTIPLRGGELERAFSIANTQALDADATLQVVVTFNHDGEEYQSNTLTLVFENGADVDHTYSGDFLALTGQNGQTPLTRETWGDGVITVVPAGAPTFARDGGGNLVSGGDTLVVDNYISGSASDRDHIDGGVGNDLLEGRGGDDTILGGAGDDMILGGDGNDTITGGLGNDYVSSSIDASSDRQQYGPGDSWLLWGLPIGATAVTYGATWGIYLLSDGGEAFWSGVGNLSTADQSDYIDGGAGNDHLIASWGADRVVGGDGDDQIAGLGGSDILEGDAGDDEIVGDGAFSQSGLMYTAPEAHGADFLDGGEGADFIMGMGEADELFGGDGNDRIFGDLGRVIGVLQLTPLDYHGNDYIDGEGGDDEVRGDGGDDTIYGGAGADMLLGDSDPEDLGDLASDSRAWGNDYLDGEGENDTLIGGGGDDTLFGGDGDDMLQGDFTNSAFPLEFSGKDTLDGEEGNDTLIGGGGEDTLWGGSGDDNMYGDTPAAALGSQASDARAWGADYLDGQEGDDQLMGGGGDDTLFGGDGNDLMQGDERTLGLAGEFHGSDFLDGEAGDDQMVGGGGNDELHGGSGADVLLGDDVASLLPEGFHGSDTLDGGDGNDSLVGGGGADQLWGDEGDDVLIGDDALESLAASAHGDDVLDGGAGNDTLAGGFGNDKLAGGDGDDVLAGDNSNEADDALALGVNADDLLDGGAGSDALFGESGNDTLLGGDGRDFLSGGTGDDVLDSGGDDGNMLLGGDGNDLLIASGADWLEGGAGDDVYDLSGSTSGTIVAVIVDSQGNNTVLGVTSSGAALYAQDGIAWLASGDSARVGFGEGTDLSAIRIGDDAATATLLDVAQQGDASGRIHSKIWVGGALVGTGDVLFNQSLSGSALADALDGGLGDDTMDGGLGDDVLAGGIGNDVIAGSAGADLIIGGHGNDILSDGSEADTSVDIYSFEAGDGEDRLEGSSTGGDGIAHDVISFGESVARDSVQFIRGGSSASTAQADVVIRYGASDTITLSNGALAQIAEVRFADGSVINRDELVLRLAEAAEPSDHVIESNGSTPGRVLVGTATADRLVGGSGHDLFVGGGGADQLESGGGTDTFVFGGDRGVDSVLPGDDGGVLKFTSATIAELRLFAAGADVVIEQPSGGAVRIVGMLASGADLAGWEVLDRSGHSVQLAGLMPAADPSGAADLAARRDEFLGRQHVGLATTPVRFIGSDGIPTFLDSLTETEEQVDAEGHLTLGNFLALGAASVTETRYDSQPIFETVTVHVPGVPARFVRLTPGGSGREQLPPGTIFVDDARTGDLIGYQVPAIPETTREEQRIVGWNTTQVQVTKTVPADTAVQAIVTGSEGSDDIVSGPSLALFRGSIATGDGDDSVRLESGRFDTGRQETNEFPGNFDAFFLNQALDRGPGAWIDLGAGDDFVMGTEADDVIIGGAGSDFMDGQDGADTYIVGYVPGDVDIVFGGEEDILEFDASVARGTLSYKFATNFEDEDGDGQAFPVETLQLFTEGHHFLTLGDWSLASVRFADGSSVELFDLLDTLQQVGPPVLTAPISQRGVGVDQPFVVSLASHFADGDGDVLFFDAFLEDGSPLPSFITLDPNTGILSGTPGTADAGSYAIVVIATDGGFDVNATFQLTVVSGGSVSSGTSYTLAPTELNLVLTGSDAISGTGNSLDNRITGNASSNALDGSNGVDTLIGGDGDDVYFVNVAEDEVVELSGQGADAVYASSTYALSDNLETLVLTGPLAIDGTGNALNNWLQGNAAANRIDGALGADSMLGGAGDDTYVVDNLGDFVVELASEGNDTVISSVNYWLTPETENVVLVGNAVTGTGNALANRLQGNAGDNTLDGAEGADTMLGAGGNDTFIVDTGADQAIEMAGEGIDTVYASISYRIGANVENLVLTGGAATTATGNELANWMQGNAGSNVLDGGIGADSMLGGNGNDTYVVDDLGDFVVEGVDQGIDTVRSSVNYWLRENTENVVLTGTADLNATGNELVNWMEGNSGSNVLNGGSGIDTMLGGAGNDSYLVDNVDDVVTEQVGGGIDTVYAQVTWQLGAQVENLVLTGNAAINGTGNAMANWLQGNGAGNALAGGGGDDYLNGMVGADTLIGGEGEDTYGFDRGSGEDVLVEAGASLNDSVQFGSDIAMDQLWFSQSGTDLRVQVIGTSDAVTLRDWYSDSAHRIDILRAGDGHALLESRVQNLVDAMASFAPPPPGETNLSASYRTELGAMIATNWQ